MLVWPSILLTVYKSVPLESCKHAYVWRKQWNVICLVIPAASIHFANGLEIQEVVHRISVHLDNQLRHTSGMLALR